MANRSHKHYGITNAEYIKMFEDQLGVCAICGSSSKRWLTVDHCHLTGKIRGLLCFACNVRLGYFERTTIAWKNAMRVYLDR